MLLISYIKTASHPIGRGLKVKEIDDLVDEIVFTENLILEVA
jgi:hypothetical protein